MAEDPTAVDCVSLRAGAFRLARPSRQVANTHGVHSGWAWEVVGNIRSYFLDWKASNARGILVPSTTLQAGAMGESPVPEHF